MLRVSEDGNRRREGYQANYKQLRDTLIDLQDAAYRIFDTISERTTKEHEKLTNLSNRIQNAKARIDSISNSKEAITIKSSSRYPSHSNGVEDFRSLFGYNDDAGFPVAKLLVNGGLNREFGLDGTLELYQYFSETTAEFLPKEVQSTVGSKTSHSNENTCIENLLQSPHITYTSLLKEDNFTADSSRTTMHQMLPPPPPSLLHSSRGLPKSEVFDFRQSVAHPSKLQSSLSELPSTSNIALWDSERASLVASSRDSGVVLKKEASEDQS